MELKQHIMGKKWPISYMYVLCASLSPCCAFFFYYIETYHYNWMSYMYELWGNFPWTGCLRLVIRDYNCYEGRQLGSGLICLLIVQHFWVIIKLFFEKHTLKSEYKTQMLNVIESWCLLWRGFPEQYTNIYPCHFSSVYTNER